MASVVVEQPWTVKRLLQSTAEFLDKKGVDSPRVCAEMVLGHVLDLPRIKLYTNFDQVPTDDERAKLRDFVKRAGAHEPVQYLTGRAGLLQPGS